MLFTLRTQAWMEADRWKKSQQDERQRWERAQADERDKWRRSQDDARRSAVRLAVAEIGKHLGAGVHSICWLTWDSKDHPEELTLPRMQAYDDEMHPLLGELLMSAAVLASLDVECYRRLRPTMDRFYTLDGRVGKAGRLLKTSPDAAWREPEESYLEDIYLEGIKLARDLPEVLAEVLAVAAETTEHTPGRVFPDGPKV